MAKSREAFLTQIFCDQDVCLQDAQARTMFSLVRPSAALGPANPSLRSALDQVVVVIRLALKWGSVLASFRP